VDSRNYKWLRYEWHYGILLNVIQWHDMLCHCAEEGSMEVVITEWAKQSYLELRNKNVFSRADYKTILRPDSERLKNYPADPKFSLSSFWGPVTDLSGKPIQNGFKMKWHNFGIGQVQLRLLIAISESDLHGKKATRAHLCQSYVKDNVSKDRREMAKLKNRIRDINLGTYYYRGLL
jgi:hypothetical protein